MEVMKRLVLLLSCTVALLGGAELSAVHTVYVLSMSKGLDQYLANRLASDHLFQVVTDPKLADAVFTDHIGESFQSQMEALYPPPPPPEKPAKPEMKDKETKEGKDKKDPKSDDAKGPGLLTDTVNKLSNQIGRAHV